MRNFLQRKITQSTILKPLSYLLIEHEDLQWFNVTLPSFLTIAFIAFFSILIPHVNIFDTGGLIDSINSSIGFFVGFYIAALAAIATFENKNLDKKIVGKPVKLSCYRADKTSVEFLTRRKFLCFLFGYCSFISIILFLAGTFAQVFHSAIKIMTPSTVHIMLAVLFTSGYMLLFFNLVITTFLGLFYLTDRLHRD